MPSPSKKCTGIKGKTLHSQAREIIANVIKFMKEEEELTRNGGSPKIPFKNIRERVLAATQISRSTYLRISKEADSLKNGELKKFSTPNKKRVKPSPKSTLPQWKEKSVRELIHDFVAIEKRRISLKGILQKLKDAEMDYGGSISSLRRLLKNMGFKWKKSADNRKTLMESYDIRLKRRQYLKTKKQYQDEGRAIYFTDETYIHSSHTTPKEWTDESAKLLKKPIGKGRRLVIVHAGGENGFVPNGLLIFKSGSKSGDYHDDMNSRNFKKWLETQLIPNLQPRSVLVVDNAPYHNVSIEKYPTTATKKIDMIKWLERKNVQVGNHLTKPELYDIIKKNKGPTKRYEIDEIMEQHGHKVLRLPPYHPELNPIEKIWALIKNEVAKENVRFTLEHVEELTRKLFHRVSVEQWRNVIQHCEKIEAQYLESDHILDDLSDNSPQFIINTVSSSEEEFSDNDNDGLSGVESLCSSDSYD